MILRITLLFGGLLLALIGSWGCMQKEEEFVPEKPVAQLDSLFQTQGKLPEPENEEEPTELSAKPYPNKKFEGDTCYERKFMQKKRFENYAVFQEQIDMFPGSIVQGRQLREGKLISIGTFPREPVEITITGLNLGSGENSKTVTPTKSNVQGAIQDLIRNHSGGTSENFTFEKTEVYSQRQAMMNIGINASFLPTNFSLAETRNQTRESEERSIVLYFKQTYFSAAVASPPNSPAGFFAPTVNMAELKTRITPDNPSGYISRVDYGWFMIVEMTSKKSYQEMKNAVDAGFKLGIAGISTNIDNATRSILQESSFKAFVRGGSGGFAITKYEDVVKYINNSLNFRGDKVPEPIGYEVRSIVDNSIMAHGTEASYTIFDCALDPIKYEVELEKLEVIQDCEETAFEGGEFYFYIGVRSKEKYYRIIDVPRSQTLNLSTGQTKALNKISEEILIFPGETHAIIGEVWEEDDNILETKSQFVGSLNEKLKFSKLKQREFKIETLLDPKSSCQVKFHFNIKVIK